MNKLPLISVLMPVYNGERFIHEAITSVISQTYQNWELIIVDDASTDDTAMIVSSFNDNRIRLSTNKKNLGLAENRNKALSLAKGELIAILDSDDISNEMRLEKQVDSFLMDEGLVICGSWANVVDKKSTIVDVWRFPKDHYDLTLRFYLQFPIVHSSAMYRRCTVESLNLKYDPAFAPAEDYDFLFKLVSYGRLKVVPELLVSYRLHDRNTSDKSKNTISFILPNLYIREYQKCGLDITFAQAQNVALFLNPKTGLNCSSSSAFITLFKLGRKLKRRHNLSAIDTIDWNVYIIKCLVLQLKNKLSFA